jgi:hypothetical protein
MAEEITEKTNVADITLEQLREYLTKNHPELVITTDPDAINCVTEQELSDSYDKYRRFGIMLHNLVKNLISIAAQKKEFDAASNLSKVLTLTDTDRFNIKDKTDSSGNVVYKDDGVTPMKISKPPFLTTVAYLNLETMKTGSIDLNIKINSFDGIGLIPGAIQAYKTSQDVTEKGTFIKLAEVETIQEEEIDVEEYCKRIYTWPQYLRAADKEGNKIHLYATVCIYCQMGSITPRPKFDANQQKIGEESYYPPSRAGGSIGNQPCFTFTARTDELAGESTSKILQIDFDRQFNGHIIFNLLDDEKIDGFCQMADEELKNGSKVTTDDDGNEIMQITPEAEMRAKLIMESNLKGRNVFVFCQPNKFSKSGSGTDAKTWIHARGLYVIQTNWKPDHYESAQEVIQRQSTGQSSHEKMTDIQKLQLFKEGIIKGIEQYPELMDKPNAQVVSTLIGRGYIATDVVESIKNNKNYEKMIEKAKAQFDNKTSSTPEGENVPENESNETPVENEAEESEAEESEVEESEAEESEAEESEAEIEIPPEVENKLDELDEDLKELQDEGILTEGNKNDKIPNDLMPYINATLEEARQFPTEFTDAKDVMKLLLEKLPTELRPKIIDPDTYVEIGNLLESGLAQPALEEKTKAKKATAKKAAKKAAKKPKASKTKETPLETPTDINYDLAEDMLMALYSILDTINEDEAGIGISAESVVKYLKKGVTTIDQNYSPFDLTEDQANVLLGRLIQKGKIETQDGIKFYVP